MDICGGDLKMSGFNPLPSCEGRPVLRRQIKLRRSISIHSPHARGDDTFEDAVAGVKISIHSPHARGDDFALVQAQILAISIHSPHARGDGSD